MPARLGSDMRAFPGCKLDGEVENYRVHVSEHHNLTNAHHYKGPVSLVIMEMPELGFCLAAACLCIPSHLSQGQ